MSIPVFDRVTALTTSLHAIALYMQQIILSTTRRALHSVPTVPCKVTMPL
jgi:hypothetical protein